MLNRLRLYAGQLWLANQYTERFAADHCEWFQRLQTTLAPYFDSFQGVRVLDVGCGLLQWQTIFFHSLGANVTGVDMEYIRADRRLDKYWHLLRTNGPIRALKTGYWDYFYRGRYLNALQACSAFPLNRDNLQLQQHEAERLPFDDEVFDLVVSHEVFEHIADVPSAVQEVKRVLKPGGMIYMNVHLFPSISGGHHIEWKYPDTEPSKRVPPWDHLREKQFPEHPSWINELRERDYRPIFEEHFEILSWEPSAYEGQTQLTPAIQAELADYSEDELLKKGVIIVGRKTPTD